MFREAGLRLQLALMGAVWGTGYDSEVQWECSECPFGSGVGGLAALPAKTTLTAVV